MTRTSHVAAALLAFGFAAEGLCHHRHKLLENHVEAAREPAHRERPAVADHEGPHEPHAAIDHQRDIAPASPEACVSVDLATPADHVSIEFAPRWTPRAPASMQGLRDPPLRLPLSPRAPPLR